MNKIIITSKIHMLVAFMGIILFLLFGCTDRTDTGKDSVKLVPEVQNNDGPEKKIVLGNIVKPVSKNHPPMIVSASILPSEPSRRSTLGVNVRATDQENDKIEYSYLWEVNGYTDDKFTGVLLEKGNFSDGDNIRVRVTPKDKYAAGEPFWTQFVLVAEKNIYPEITSLYLSPNPCYKGDTIKVFSESVDLNGDSVDLSYAWKRNGVDLYGELDPELNTSSFDKGDSIVVTLTPADSFGVGKSVRSKPLLISNSPPVLAMPSGKASIENELYKAQISAKDPDYDLLTYSLLEGPPGMSIDSHTGEITWPLLKNVEDGKHRVVVKVRDSDGAVAQLEYNINLGISRQGHILPHRR